MICFPNAKINLGLNVVSKRPDGYHNIETIFYPIPVKDALEIVASDQPSFTGTGIPVDAPQEKNLVIKALNALKTRYEIPPLEIHLLKAIPFGAGLGGGSADAAFMLKLVNDFCGLDIHPDVAVSTPEAYSMVTPATPETSLKEIIRLPVSEWKERMVNDFERSVFPKHPVIERIKDTLYEGGALYAAMSGSGSSVFGLFEKPTHFKEQSLFSDCFLWEGQLS